MLAYASGRPTVILAVMGMICVAAARPASAQATDSATQFDSASWNDEYVAQEAGKKAGEAAKEPTPAPPAPKKTPPSAAQPATPTPAPSPLVTQEAAPGGISSMLAARSPLIRLAGLPNMFGDSFGNQLRVCDFAGCGVVTIPAPGGTRGVKISENDKALPMDRVFFIYNHFQNAVEANIVSLGPQSYPIDQYTLGLEKTFRDGLWSVELRLPFVRTPRVAGANLEVGTGDVGNLVVTLKRLLYASETTVVGMGLPIATPTGGDVTGQGAFSTFSLSNDAVHLAPFVGFLTEPNDRLFCEGFLQVDVATNGNRVLFGDHDLGRLTEQTLLYVDLALGYWVHRNPYSRYITGLAPMVEYHYTTTLENAPIVSGTDGYQFLQFGNTYNRQDISNLTVGLHTELGKTTVRVGGAFPLSGTSNRLYDGEVLVSVDRRF